MKHRTKQRIVGLLFALLGVASIFIEYDGTVALFAVPIGIAVAFTKQDVLSI